MKQCNIFVVGLDDFHLAQLRTLPNAAYYRFHSLFTRSDLKCADEFPVRQLLKAGTSQLRRFPGSVDAVVGYWDFPVSTVLPILRGVRGLPGPTLEAVLKCEHKYWSRLEQSRVVPGNVPTYCAVDPFATDPLADLTVEFPFWIKPVKAVLSYLGFRVENPAQFHHAIDEIRRGIHRFGDPFNHILGYASLPPGVAAIGGNHCIVESLICAGRQCTLEGYVYQGAVRVYGVVDSYREGAASSSFSRYQYPSALPADVQARMAEIAGRVMTGIGYDNGPFNMECYWDEARDHIWLLEINPRISKSHAPLFWMVDGRYHHQVMIDLGLGRAPDMPTGKGPHACAAKFMVRHHEDACVARVPTLEDIRRIEAEIPGVVIELDVTAGMQLSALRNQDSYTYEVATVFLGAESEEALLSRYQQVLERLRLEFEPVAQPRHPVARGLPA